MSDVPSDLHREILLRVPAESLLRLRKVCKQWLRIIDDSSFIKHHTHNQQNSPTLLLTNRIGDTLYFFCLDSLHFINGPQLIDAIHIKLLPQQISIPIVSFCNGLILMEKKIPGRGLVIWNPLTDERRYVNIPQQINVTLGLWRYAFGYDYDADDYKVVVIYQDCETHVYSLKSDSWRRIQNCPRRVHFMGKAFFTSLYWLSEDMLTIIALHLGTDTFSEFPLPLVDRSGFSVYSYFRLDVLDGCLICSLDYTERKTFYGWVMKDKSWIKLFSLQYSIHKVPPWSILVAYLKRKQQVVLVHTRGFLWFDIGTDSVKMFSIHDFPRIGYSRIYPGSLVRLNVRDSTIGVEDIAARRISERKIERRVTRLKFCVRDVGAMCWSDDDSSCIANKCLLCRVEDE